MMIEFMGQQKKRQLKESKRGVLALREFLAHQIAADKIAAEEARKAAAETE